MRTQDEIDRAKERRILSKLSRANRFRLMYGQPLFDPDDETKFLDLEQQQQLMARLRIEDDERESNRSKDL